MVGTMQPKVLADFYKQVFNAPSDSDDEGWYGWLVGNTYFMIGEHSEMGGKTKDPGRIMINLETKDVKGEFERIKKIEGAEVVKEPYEMGGMWIATFADPDGNYFQLMPPWKQD